MKWFSWTTGFFLLCLLLIWSSGYWLWSQTLRSQYGMQKSEITQQLEISQTLLVNWQQSYRLNLGYLQKQLADWDPVSVDNPLIDPWQEIDDKLNHALWQDRLLAYAILDNTGRVLRLSANRAGDLFAQTRAEPVAEFFLPPLIMHEQWIIPVLFRVNNQSIMLWFDAVSLKEQIVQQLSKNHSLTEFQLISQQGEFWSPSKYRRTLLARLGTASSTPLQLERFYAKKPPEDLTQSRQRFDSSAAWPFTSVFLAMQKLPQGASADYYPNYMGRPALAVWRWSDAWQAYIVIERDAALVVTRQRSWWRYGLMALISLTILLSFGFYFAQRRLFQANGDDVVDAQWALVNQSNAEPASMNVTDFSSGLHTQTELSTPVDSIAANNSIDDSTSASGAINRPTVLPSAQRPVISHDDSFSMADVNSSDGKCFMRALPKLFADQWPVDSYRQTEQQHGQYAVEMLPTFAQMLQDIRLKLPQHEIGLEFADDMPVWLLLAWPSMHHVLQYMLIQACRRAEKSEIILRVMLAEQQQLRCEIIDGGASLTEGQWLHLLNAVGNAHDDVILRKVQAELLLLSAQLSGVSEPGGNKLIITAPVTVLQHFVDSSQTELQLLDATALLLSPVGELQHLYRRLLRHTGLELMPLDDAEQFLQWCGSQQQHKLDYLLLDEQFVQADVALAGRLLHVVRRYFPEIQLLVMTTQPGLWHELATTLQLRLLLKPLVNTLLQQALVSKKSGIFAFGAQKIWLYQPDPLQYWFEEQQLLALGYQVQKVSNIEKLSGLSANDLVLVPSTLQADLALNNCRALILWTCQTCDQLAGVQHGWLVGQGACALSRQLFVLLSSRKYAE